MTRRITPTATLVLPASAPRDEWLAARRGRTEVPGFYCIGSSDVANILDLPHVGTPAEVYHDKVNAMEAEVNEAMTWGQVFEEPIAQEWCRRNRTVIRRIGLVSNVDEPWHQTTLDRRIVGCPLKIEGGCGLEIKNSDTFVYQVRWHDEVPDRILAQIVHQLYVTGLHHMHYAIKVGNKMIQGVIYRERELKLMEFVRTSVNAFRDNHLLPKIEPPWTADTKVEKYLELEARLHPVRVGELAISDLDLVIEYAEWSRKEGEARKEKNRLKLQLALLADGHQIMKLGDERAFWYGEGHKVKVNDKRLLERYPEVYNDDEIVTHTSYPILNIDSDIRKMEKGS